MGFRTLEISSACDIHIKQETIGNIIRWWNSNNSNRGFKSNNGSWCQYTDFDNGFINSESEQSSLMTLDEKYLPTAIVLPFEGHARQSKLMHSQVKADEEECLNLWMQIIEQKICNQSRALSIMGKKGAEDVARYLHGISRENVDSTEALAAREYFAYYHDGLNRRGDDPINSRLNYGYAVVRSAIARSLVASGFHSTFGIHHDNQLNAFNLADDLIEPYRAIVDIVAYDNIGSNVRLTKNERQGIAHVLHNACVVDGVKVNVLSAIDMMVESLKRIILDRSGERIALPVVLPIESLEGITE